MSSHLDAFWQNYCKAVENLLEPLSSTDGVSEHKLAAAEKRLGITIPRVLRDYYLLTATRTDINACNDRLVSTDDLVIQNNRLVFYDENQSVCVWGVDLSDPANENPAVWRGSMVTEESEWDWDKSDDQLSDFLMSMLFWQAVNGGMPYTGVGEAHTDQIGLVAGWEVHDVNGEWPHVLTRDGQALLVVGKNASPEVYGGGRTRADFLALTETFDIVWGYSTLDEEDEDEEEENED